jgi:serine acetyltransferase
MLEQLKYFLKDYQAHAGRQKMRMLLLWMNPAIIGLLGFRIDRGFFLLFKGYWKYLRLIFLPLFYLIYIISRIDIHYKANIGYGLKILHSSLGIVISGETKIGNYLTLTGGNCIGINNRKGTFSIGNNCNVGANACIIGPCILGENIRIGAGAIVTKNFGDNTVLIGVPAEPYFSKE